MTAMVPLKAHARILNLRLVDRANLSFEVTYDSEKGRDSEVLPYTLNDVRMQFDLLRMDASKWHGLEAMLDISDYGYDYYNYIPLHFQVLNEIAANPDAFRNRNFKFTCPLLPRCVFVVEYATFDKTNTRYPYGVDMRMYNYMGEDVENDIPKEDPKS
jgi:hypothetical protein